MKLHGEKKISDKVIMKRNSDKWERWLKNTEQK